MAKEIQEYQEAYGKAGMDFDNNEWNKVKWLFDMRFLSLICKTRKEFTNLRGY